jgi:HTH-type transcriptional regulator/antitoxin HigA
VDTVASLLRVELARLGWVQADLARVLGWQVQTLSELMQDKRRLDAGMALDLAQLTARTAGEWLAAQAAADIAKVENRPETPDRLSQIAARSDLEKQVPVRELIKRGAISAADPATQAREIAALLGADPTLGVYAKRSTFAFTRTQTAWVALARKQAERIDVARYDNERFAKLVESLPTRIQEPVDFLCLPDEFATAGVGLVYVKPFPGGRIDGVSMGLGANPVIALSGRGKRLDKVLFTLLHECAHVVNDHWVQSPRLHEAGEEWVEGEDDIEQAMNDLATSWIFPAGIPSLTGSVNKQTISNFAEAFGVSPAMIVGHLQHRSAIDWSSVLGRGLPSVDEVLAKWP